MTPATWILWTLTVGGWFVGLPFAVAHGHNRDGSERHIALWQGFGIVWGITLGCILFMAALLALDHWYLNRGTK